MGSVLRFIAWVLQQAWRIGRQAAQRVADWARRNWRTVQRWIEQGVAWGTILEWILRAVGLG